MSAGHPVPPALHEFIRNSGGNRCVQVIGPTDHWILERLARRLAAKLPYSTFVPWEPQRGGDSGIAYYVNYALFQGPTTFVDVGFFTHRDDRQEFLWRAQRMDYCVSMSRMYADWLRAEGIERVVHIPMGFDAHVFRPRLVLGVVGRLEHARKGRHLIDMVRALPFVDVRITEGTLGADELVEFYQTIDYVLIASTVEGGPMCLLEGLAVGKPVIAPDSVGMVPEFPMSSWILRYPTDDGEALLRIVARCYQEKCGGSQLTQRRTWDNWAEQHHRLFISLAQERGVRLPEPAPGFRFGMMTDLEIPFGTDVVVLERIIDLASVQLYFGDYGKAKSLLIECRQEFPCIEHLVETFPG